VVIVHFAVVQIAEQSRVDHGLRRHKLTGPAALETDAGAELCLLDGGYDRAAVLERHRQRLLDDQMLASVGRGNRLRRVLVGIAADRDDVERAVGQEVLQVLMASDRPAASRATSFISGRDEYTAVTSPLPVAWMASIWAPATQPYPMMPTLYVFMQGPRIDSGSRFLHSL
jgi:hypothetical protein